MTRGDPSDASEEEAPVAIPIEDALDLHPFAPRDIPDVVAEYLAACCERGYREVRLIHGRGTGTQRRIVRALLTRLSCVEEFADAPPERGGWGATVVRLTGR
jgi:DNA-nicking Smr family endonuclease